MFMSSIVKCMFKIAQLKFYITRIYCTIGDVTYGYDVLALTDVCMYIMMF